MELGCHHHYYGFGHDERVYILFCVIQFTYLFGGEATIRSIPDYTLAEYARRGFCRVNPCYRN